MTTVLLSDIHANLEAFQAVLAAVDARKPDRILCLGDVVGYGASPNECLDLVRSRCEVVLLGNHDAAASGGPEAARFNVYARTAAEWTARTLTRDNREYLQKLPLTAPCASFFCVHASPATPRDWEYLLDRFDAEPQFAYFTEPVCFIGHTHQPAVFMADPDGTRSRPVGTLRIDPARRYIVNVGSVGQPRDRDPRSSFVLVGDTYVEFVRVMYDVDTTVRKVEAIPELDNFLGTRLLDGR